ncbi:hypothetical protein BGW41_005911 [Actinomortierella wolfii]|nr:hypothetical protein BGW41_005911 [Actinomortierella wolfii]
MPHAVVLVSLRRAILRYLDKTKRSPFEYLTLMSLALLVGAIIKYPNRAYPTKDRPDLKGKTAPANFENYHKGPMFHWALTDILGDGIFVSDGAQWRFHRKTASNIFTTKFYRSLVKGHFKHTAMDLIRAIERSRLSGKEFVDLEGLFLKLTLDAFGKLTFGLDFQSLAKEGPNEFGDAFDFLTHLADARVTNPFFFVTEYIPWTYVKKRRALGILNKFAAMAVNARRAEAPEQKELRQRDLLDHFINYKTEDGQMLTDKELRDVFVNFMIAGRDTTAQTLAWQFYQLIVNPRVTQKLVEEIDTVLEGSEERMTYETLMHEMPYLKAVMHETLRLHPPVSKNAKMAIHDDVLPCGTKVCAGDFIGYSTWAMGRTRAVWGEDAEVFIPERWIDDNGKFKPQSQYKFNSFNGGPRICLGQTFATIEILQTTCMLLQRYTFRMTPNHPTVTYKGSITLPMLHPLQTIVTPREGVSPLLVYT